jgi:tetratricopeptide (TPR) repeat protein
VILLADVHLRSGNLDEADNVLESAIAATRSRRSPELSQLYQRKAELAVARGDRDEQLNCLQQAFSADKNNGLAAAQLADLAEELENWDVATKVLRSISLMEGECPISRAQAFFRQGLISHRLGDIKRAVFWGRRAAGEDPESEEIQSFLAQLESDAE